MSGHELSNGFSQLVLDEVSRLAKTGKPSPCAAVVDRQHLGRFLAESFIGCLPAEGAVGSVVVAVVFPRFQFVVEYHGVVDDGAVE
jgi:hypothetical protein